MKLSIILNFYNMQREAARTLYSVSREYQTGAENIEYEVIAIDNGSTRPLQADLVQSFGNNFKLSHFEAQHPSPCEAINSAVRSANGEYVMCCIDGARILSPGIINKTLKMTEVYKRSFVYTIGMHLGHKPQNFSLLEGYNQEVEDTLIDSTCWRGNGYDLFNISSVALSSKQGFFSEITESNCFTMLRDDYLGMGGYNESFTSKGGGICNLDIFNRAREVTDIVPILLLGEATFHQFHGGVATNVPMDVHPIEKMCLEYQQIYGNAPHDYDRTPIYFGDISAQARRFVGSTEINL